MKSLAKPFLRTLLLAMLAMPSVILGAEHWDVYAPNQVPWDTIRAMTVFKNTLYVSGSKGQSLSYLWSSTDGVQWTEVNVPETPLLTYAAAFETYGDSLYMFTVSSSPFSGLLNILKSADGHTWSIVNGFGAFGSGTWTDTRIYKNVLYAGDNRGRLQMSEDGDNWSINPEFPEMFGNERYSISMAEHDQKLYVAKGIDSTFAVFTEISKTSDGIIWEQETAPASGEFLRPGTVSQNNALFWAGLFLEKATLQTTSLEWQQNVTGNLPFPFLMDNRVHSLGLPDMIYQLTDTNKWESVFQGNSNSCATAVPRYPKIITVGNDSFLAPCNLLRYRRGVHAISATAPQLNMARAQTNVPFLSLQFDVNTSERLTNIRIINMGTARDGIDIAGVALFRSNNGVLGEKISELEPGTDGISWSVPLQLNTPLVDGDVLIIAGDVADNATHGATVKISVPTGGASFETNSAYTITSSLVASNKQTVIVPEAASLPNAEGLTIYPSPAKNHVRLLYSLSGTSDVEVNVYDRRGVKVLQLRESGKEANPQAITFLDCKDVPTGIYYAVLKIEGVDHRTLKKKFAIEK